MAELVSKFVAMAAQSGNGGAKWQWRSKLASFVAMAEQSGNGEAKRQWRS